MRTGPALAAARAALGDERAWIVGGAVRDLLLGRDILDLDLAVAGDVRAAAGRLARAVDGPLFPLSEAFGAWRVLAPDRAWRADLAPLQGGGIKADLARRDLTINAMAEPLVGGPPVDPFGGREDLAAERLRMVGASAFEDDPLRVLRLARIAAELGFDVEPETLSAVHERAGGLARVAGERVFAELRRILVSDGALRGLELMETTGATAVVLPELLALRGVEQSAYHHLDVHDHSLAVLEELIRVERAPERFLGPHAAAVAELLQQPLADELTRAQALRFGALLHDVAKPETRDVTASGRVTFLGHDAAGADAARDILARLRASERLRSYVAALTRHHLRLGFLVHERPLAPRAVHAYLEACGDVAVDVTVLSVADRLATRGRRAEEAIGAHLELAGEMLGEAVRREVEGPPVPLVRGDELAAELGIEAGPALGSLLAELEAATFAGEVATRREAVAHARSVLERDV